jgi:hypothetical protein
MCDRFSKLTKKVASQPDALVYLGQTDGTPGVEPVRGSF